MKYIKYVIATFVFGLFMVDNTLAANASISVSASKNLVMVGENVTVTVKVSSSSNLGSWTFDVAPSSNLTLVDSSFGGLYIRDVVGSGNEKSHTYTFKFKANSSGTGTVTIKNSEVYGFDEVPMKATNGSTSFKMMTYAELEATYSKNNYLSSLKIDGYDLTPSFDKRTDKYTVEVPNGTEKVNISATKEDWTASVRGTGEKEVSEGANEFKIVVTAQNGSTRTYTLTVNVKELDPINVKVDGKDYTVIRKEEFLPTTSHFFEKTTIKIGEEEVPAYYAETIKTTLVALKDEAGTTELYVYDNDKYTKYTEISFGSIFFIPKDATNVPNGYIETSIDITGVNYKAYKSETYEFPLLYGMNVATGKTDFYKYDKDDNTIQRYEEVVIDKSTEELYFYIIIGLFGFTVLSYIIFITLLCKRNKKNKEVIEKTITNLNLSAVELENPKKKKDNKNVESSEDEIAKL